MNIWRLVSFAMFLKYPFINKLPFIGFTHAMMITFYK